MNKQGFYRLFLLFAVLFSAYVRAMPVDISWSNPHQYRDLTSTIQTRSAIQKQFFTAINRHLTELSVQLPKGYHLSLNVKQVDLAGNIEPFNGQRIRVFKEMYYPNMRFSYHLTNKKQQFVLSGDAIVKGRNFLMNVKSIKTNETFKYEKAMLTQWFEQELLVLISEAK